MWTFDDEVPDSAPMTPAELGFAMPPEWALQEAVWLSWPVDDPRHWGGAKLQRIEEKFAEIAAAITRFEPVRINASARQHERIRTVCQHSAALPERVELFDHPHDDVWCRDHGPLFVKHRETGEVAVTDWEFNAWGGKFPPWDSDNRIPERIASSLAMRRFAPGIVLEGGAIELNGCGQLLTTEAVLLHPNRNPSLDRKRIETILKDFLGASEILWLEKGIAGDDTDGHIDDLARFAGDEIIIAASSSTSPDREVLAANRRRLNGFLTARGRPFEIVEIPLPEPCEVPGWRLPVLPASYVNFLLVNGGLLAPTFRQKSNDDRALGTLRELFPDREVVGIDCLELVEEGGSLHCISQQQPA